MGSTSELSLWWWYEHLLAMDEAIDPHIIESLGQLAVLNDAEHRMPTALSARVYLRALRSSGDPGAASGSAAPAVPPPAVPVTSEAALESLGVLSALAAAFAHEFHAGVDLRKLRPPPGLIDELAVFLLARRLAEAVRGKKRAPTQEQVGRQLQQLAEGAGLGAILGGAGLQTK